MQGYLIKLCIQPKSTVGDEYAYRRRARTIIAVIKMLKKYDKKTGDNQRSHKMNLYRKNGKGANKIVSQNRTNDITFSYTISIRHEFIFERYTQVVFV